MSCELPVFHIGANKAGSTTLQRALFARHPQILNLAKPAPIAEVKQAVDKILRACECNENLPDLDLSKLRRLWQTAVSAVAIDLRTPLYSREELIRSYFYGNADPERLPKAIAAMVGPLRVVLIARNQLKLIESLYIHKSNMMSYMTMEQWLESQPDRFAYGYQYCQIADAWASVVGEANVGVFLFEELVSDSATFAKRLCNFIGIDAEPGAALLSEQHENIRKSRRTQSYVRLRSALLPKITLGGLLPPSLRQAWHEYLDGGPRARAALPYDWLHHVEEHYRTDNRKLAERFHLPLDAHHYPM